jgi:hypothetical protein
MKKILFHAVLFVALLSQTAFCQYLCPGGTCGSDLCRCASRLSPGTLSPPELPQFILVTFDDGINSFTESLIQPAVGGLHNPDGSNAPLTYFVTKVNTDASLARQRFFDGNELANHTATHLTGTATTAEEWRQEFSVLNQFLVNQVGLPSDQIAGFRSPNLATNEPMWQVLKEYGFLYDASIPEIVTVPPLVSTGPDSFAWPHTLDYGSGLACRGNHCPDSPLPGVWSIPLWVWYDKAGINYGAMDPATGSDSLFHELLDYDFQKRYSGNRCPLGIFMHAGQLGFPARREVLRSFLVEKLKLPDVWMITMRGLVEWMRNPVPVSALSEWFRQGRHRGVGRIALSPPPFPVLLSPSGAATVPVSGVNLNWDVLLAASSYHLQVSTTPDFSASVLDTMFLPAAAFTLQNLAGPASYYWRVRGINSAGAGPWSEQRMFTTTTVAGVRSPSPLPGTTRLEQSYPNPFNPNSEIRYQIADYGKVRLSVFDLLGREIAVLVNETKSPGTYTVRFDGSGLASGFYFYRLTAGGYTETRKMIYAR